MRQSGLANGALASPLILNQNCAFGKTGVSIIYSSSRQPVRLGTLEIVPEWTLQAYQHRLDQSEEKI
jgi:hypothetical protein